MIAYIKCSSFFLKCRLTSNNFYIVMFKDWISIVNYLSTANCTSIFIISLFSTSCIVMLYINTFSMCNKWFLCYIISIFYWTVIFNFTMLWTGWICLTYFYRTSMITNYLCNNCWSCENLITCITISICSMSNSSCSW